MNKFVITGLILSFYIFYKFFAKKKYLKSSSLNEKSCRIKKIRNTKLPSIEQSFYIVTWNVGTKYPDNLLLNQLLNLEKHPEHDVGLPDFYVIGLQEVSSGPQNVFMGLFKDDPWTSKLKELLKLRDYVVVKTEQMQGLLINIFTRRKHLVHLRDIESEYTRCGLGGMWGNKGAVSVRMNLYGSTLCFVNAHLAAHDHMFEERINDYDKIVQEHKFHVKDTEHIFHHDYVFWFGDLNFRLTGEATSSPEEIRALVSKEKLPQLLEKDQLRIVMEQKRAFNELKERKPAFPPTFKFEPGTMDYDMKRRPAWTDRILYKPLSEIDKRDFKLELEQKSYKSHPTYSISDHKPVSSEFTIKVNVDDEMKSIEFSRIPLWVIGEDMMIEYTLPPNFEELNSDWIGIYKEDFAGTNEYVSYEYASRSTNPSFENRLKRTISMTFSDDADVHDGNYVLIYFQSTGTRGVTGIAGISEPFHAEKRCESPRFDSID